MNEKYKPAATPRGGKRTSLLLRFGDRVRAKREKNAISQTALAKKCKFNRSYIWGIEHGRRNVALANVNVIARALDVSLGELFKGL